MQDKIQQEIIKELSAILNGPASGLYFTHTGSLLLNASELHCLGEVRCTKTPAAVAAVAAAAGPRWLERQDLCFNWTLLHNLVTGQQYFWVLPVVRVCCFIFMDCIRP